MKLLDYVLVILTILVIIAVYHNYWLRPMIEQAFTQIMGH